MFDQNALRIIDSINVPVLVTDGTGIITARNKAAVVFFHRDIVTGWLITEILPAVVIRDNSELLSLKDGEACYFFDVKADINGKIKETDVDVVLFTNGGDRSYICTVKDISIYSELTNSINKFGNIVENSPASVLITDTNGNIEFLNNNFQQLTGYSYEELMGGNINMLQSPFQEKNSGRVSVKR